ncbi:MAG: hypothetical protein RIQ79_1041 [Verrucomicrobiota bacterium]
MKHPPSITLLTSRLDFGGVADHVALLANALAERGVKVSKVTRERDFARAITTSAHTDANSWIGLHFVAYGWAKHGVLKRTDIEQLRVACTGRRVAIYLHELWIGAALGVPLKQRVFGALQRRSLLRLVATLRPERLLTSNPVYKAMLAREGLDARVLPLPGNLPPSSETDRHEARAWLSSVGIGGESRPDLAAVFGLIHPEWDAHVAVADWRAHVARKNRSSAILAVGRHGSAGPRKLAALREHLPGLRVVSAGEQPASLLAGLLAECSLGLATTPWSLIGKSGTAAAFMEAGLPVLVTRDDWRWRHGPTPSPVPHPRLWKWTGTSPFAWDQFLAARASFAPGLAQVADAWLQFMSEPRTAPCAS